MRGAAGQSQGWEKEASVKEDLPLAPPGISEHLNQNTAKAQKSPLIPCTIGRSRPTRASKHNAIMTLAAKLQGYVVSEPQL